MFMVHDLSFILEVAVVAGIPAAGTAAERPVVVHTEKAAGEHPASGAGKAVHRQASKAGKVEAAASSVPCSPG